MHVKHRVNRELYDYWQRLRAGRLAPERSEIEPSDIRKLLSDTFILEVAPGPSYHYRLAGTRICSAYGREMKGKDFLAFFGDKDRQAVGSLLAATTEDGAAAVIGFVGTSQHGRELPFECLVLPVSQRGQGLTRILGGLVPMDDFYWIGIHPIVRQEVSSLRLIWPDERATRLQAGIAFDRVPGEARRSAVIPAENPDTRRRVGHLVVYDGGKA